MCVNKYSDVLKNNGRFPENVLCKLTYKKNTPCRIRRRGAQMSWA